MVSLASPQVLGLDLLIYSCVVLGIACMVSEKENDKAWPPIAASKGTSDRQANF